MLAAQASVAVAQANLDKAKVFQGFTKIVSHYDGVVTLRNFHNGDFIRQADKGGQTPLLVVQRTDLMRVVAQVPDMHVPFADVGDAVEFSIDNLPEEVFKGFRLSRIAASEDEHSRTMRVEIDVPNPKRFLRDGMFGEVTIHLQTPLKGAMTLPLSTLVRDERNPRKCRCTWSAMTRSSWCPSGSAWTTGPRRKSSRRSSRPRRSSSTNIRGPSYLGRK